MRSVLSTLDRLRAPFAAAEDTDGMDLDGCAALVTGGSGDIGPAITRALATAGADVAVTYLSERDRADSAAAQVAGQASAAWSSAWTKPMLTCRRAL
jgi:NAD(P)-dependent dehydrogenase (short-subunit alcohol dehydrogenase family)